MRIRDFIKEEELSTKKLKIAYICVHNSCRSQIAEALTKLYHSDFFEAFSAGTKLKDSINEDALKTMNNLHKYDMSATQKSKLITNLPKDIDIVVTMGCNVSCPSIKSNYREDWGLDDPTGKQEEVFIDIISIINEKIINLRKRVESKQLK